MKTGSEVGGAQSDNRTIKTGSEVGGAQSDNRTIKTGSEVGLNGLKFCCQIVHHLLHFRFS
jgi:hypothetical protein